MALAYYAPQCLKVLTYTMAGLDPLHGQGSKAFAQMFGYPSWFPTVIGLWEGATAALCFTGEPQMVTVAMQMCTVLMGGAVYTHVVKEGKPLHAVGALAYLAMATIVLAATKGVDAAAVAPLQVAFAAIGVFIGVVISALSAGGKPMAK